MISVIIPTFNEAANIAGLVRFLQTNAGTTEIEIIVSDAGSTDNTMRQAADAGATVMLSPAKGRAAQMNFAASNASHDILYFVHADTMPPADFYKAILDALRNGYDCGRCCTTFMSNSFLLKLNAWFTSFDMFVCYGGDQTFFITRQLFNKLNGYDETKLIMEDYDITERARKMGNYKILNKAVLVSARKYDNNGWLTVQRANYKAVRMYKKGVATSLIAQAYKTSIKP